MGKIGQRSIGDDDVYTLININDWRTSLNGKIHRGNGFAVIEKNGEYQISLPKGITGEPAFFSITKELMEKAFKSSDDAYEVMIYADTVL